jgi:hypothetical protein
MLLTREQEECLRTRILGPLIKAGLVQLNQDVPGLQTNSSRNRTAFHIQTSRQWLFEIFNTEWQGAQVFSTQSYKDYVFRFLSNEWVDEHFSQKSADGLTDALSKRIIEHIKIMFEGALESSIARSNKHFSEKVLVAKTQLLLEQTFGNALDCLSQLENAVCLCPETTIDGLTTLLDSLIEHNLVSRPKSTRAAKDGSDVLQFHTNEKAVADVMVRFFEEYNPMLTKKDGVFFVILDASKVTIERVTLFIQEQNELKPNKQLIFEALQQILLNIAAIHEPELTAVSEQRDYDERDYTAFQRSVRITNIISGKTLKTIRHDAIENIDNSDELACAIQAYLGKFADVTASVEQRPDRKSIVQRHQSLKRRELRDGCSLRTMTAAATSRLSVFAVTQSQDHNSEIQRLSALFADGGMGIVRRELDKLAPTEEPVQVTLSSIFSTGELAHLRALLPDETVEHGEDKTRISQNMT